MRLYRKGFTTVTSFFETLFTPRVRRQQLQMATEISVSVTINVAKEGFKTTVVNNRLLKCCTKQLWSDVCENVLADVDLDDDTHVSLDKGLVDVSLRGSTSETFISRYDDQISVAYEFDKSLKYITFTVKLQNIKNIDCGPDKKSDAFSILMNNAGGCTKDAPVKNPTGARFTEKDRLHNDVRKHMSEVKAGFPNSMTDDVIMKHMSTLTNAFWYLDGNTEKLMERGTHMSEVHPFPQRLANIFTGYNDWKKKRKRSPYLNVSDLKKHSAALFAIISLPFTSSWGTFRTDLENLALNTNSYAEFLERSNQDQQKRQCLTHPVRQVGENCWLEHRSETDNVHPRYSIIDNAICGLDCYQFLLFDEERHVSENYQFKSRQDKYYFVEHMQFSVPVDVLKYNPGGSVGGTVVFWRTPVDRDTSEIMNSSLRVLENVRPLLPEFHTRQMRRQFTKSYCNLPAVNGIHIPSYILRSIYSELTGDSTCAQNPALDDRVRQAILSEDPDLVLDMRHLNPGRPGDKFSVFFDHLAKIVDNLSAADERRHNVEHLSKFISVRDLINQVETEGLPPNTPIPSESTVLFSFVPKNAHANVSKLYKSRIPLQFKVQTRQLRSSHQDDHYCAAIFKYMRAFAVKYRNDTSFLCIDDKSKVDFGEPRQAVSSGVRGKKSIVPIASTLSALDHDMQSKGSITPSVCLHVDIPDSVEESFYRGFVTVTYKDSIFQQSSPWRHAVELEQILKKGTVPPILMLYSDGGPDHRITYHSVKLSLIILFKKLDLDLLVAGRTAPGHSWLNPAERIMSLLNLALQNVALTREECNSEIERILQSANSMSDIRSKAEKNVGLKEAWLMAVTPILELLENRTKRIELKGKPFVCHTAANEEAIKQFEEKIHQVVDPLIHIGQYQEKQVSTKIGYKEFLADHCRERSYTFQI